MTQSSADLLAQSSPPPAPVIDAAKGTVNPPVPGGNGLAGIDSLAEFWALVRDVWTYGVGGISLGDILIALTILFVFLVFRQFFSRFVLRRVEVLAERTDNRLDDTIATALAAPIRFVPAVMGVFFATEYLALTGTAQEIATSLNRSLIVLVLFWGFYRMVDPLSFLLSRVERVFTSAMVEWLIKAIKLIIAMIGVATVLEIWGIQVAPIIAGLGLFGVAVALGAQDLFKNLIAGILILTEKRFAIGEWIRVDGVVEGTVESIGFRSTFIRRFDKAPVFVPNAQLSDSAVTNFSRMTHRRIYWMIGVEYRTTIPQLKEIRDGIEAYILSQPDFVPPERATMFVRVDSFNASSIDIMLYCFTHTTVWGEWLSIKEKLAYAIKDIVEGAGTGFAFPSQSVYIETVPGEAPEAFNPPAAKNPVAKKAEPKKVEAKKAGSKRVSAKRAAARRAQRKVQDGPSEDDEEV
ncbi:MAG: mechanosensitive ion channel family protein [Alphaproteobacteria bacterium]|uniref:mechanosensitive ion channel family protein n=1 Tax=Pacificispira sp. TaxID=2888761 RepID=UPI002E9FB302|nr:mechanosensitive ion channel family protein [Pseudomonadota bacterium]